MVGAKASVTAWTWPMASGFAVTFGAFLLLFMAISKRNALRILGDAQPLSFILNCFDANSYILMAVMAFLGASVRVSTFVPDQAIASFYCGLGLALALAGINLAVRYIMAWEGERFRKGDVSHVD
jgi:hypothetical protein